jgi:polysaccharide chain length determinant protein (PEP-CTERM system associated)
MIKYQRQSINPTAMSPDVQSRINDIVSTLSQQITSRNSLEELIKRFDLYKQSQNKQPMEDVIVAMRDKHIKIVPAKRGDIFQVSYTGSDPKKVTQVTNAIASKFVEENIRYREERVTETSAYIKEELRMAKEALDKKDRVMRDYKLKYYNELPDRLANNNNRLNSLQAQYQNNQSNIQNLEQTRLLIQEQITLRKEIQSKMVQQSADSSADRNMIYKSQDPVADLAQMRLDLEILRSRYTDNHPEIKRLKKIIANRETSLQEQSSQPGETTENGGNLAPVIDPQLEQLITQTKEIEFNIANLKKEKITIKSEIEKYTKWVEAAPFREAEWSSLTRDYDQLNKHYDTLVAQSLAAESAESLERSQKGSQFKIIDPARFPEKPVKPDFIKIMLIALALGLACGAGISYSLETLDTSFKDASDVETYLGIPVACSIPIIHTEKERQKKKIQSLLWALTFILPTLVLVVGIVYLLQKGTIII